MERHDPLVQVSTAAYSGRQTLVQDVEEAVRQKTTILTRTYKRDARLLVAVLLLSCLLSGSVTGNIFQGLHGVREVVYVLRVDHLGNEQPLLRLTELPVTPDQSVVIGTLMTWVELVRIIPEDPVVLGKQWEKAESFMTNAALSLLKPFRLEQKMRFKLGRRVQITQPKVVPIPQSRSYTVEWEEYTYDQEGKPIREECAAWSATVTIADFHSKVAQQERDLRREKKDYRNILGVLVDGVRWQSRPLLKHIPDA